MFDFYKVLNRCGDIDVVRALLAAPTIDVNATCHNVKTSLHIAAWEGHIDVMKALLKLGAPNIDVDTAGHNDETSLHREA